VVTVVRGCVVVLLGAAVLPQAETESTVANDKPLRTTRFRQGHDECFGLSFVDLFISAINLPKAQT